MGLFVGAVAVLYTYFDACAVYSGLTVGSFVGGGGLRSTMCFGVRVMCLLYKTVWREILQFSPVWYLRITKQKQVHV